MFWQGKAMIRSSAMCMSLFLSVGFVCPSPCAAEPGVQPGEPVECNEIVIDPNHWKATNTSTKLYPWQGREVVFLTTRSDLDREVMARFLSRLDDGWRLYADLTGRRPEPF
jgi:hypothetical protein